MAGEGLPGGKPGDYHGLITEEEWVPPKNYQGINTDKPANFPGLVPNDKWSGIDNSGAKRFLKILNEAYEDLMRVLFSRTGEFIDEMGRYWAAPVAREFFTRIFIPKVNEMITYCHTTMSTVNSTVNNASTTWAKHNKATWSNVSFAASSKKQLDGAASAIKDSINDIQGIDKANAITAMSKFRNYKKDIMEAINKVASAANKAGFLGGNQNSSLVNAMKKLATKLTNAMEEITLAMEKAITQTVEIYEDKEGKISSSFEEFGSGISEFVSGAVEAVATLFDFS